MKRTLMVVAVMLLGAGSAWAQVCEGRESGSFKAGGAAAFGSNFHSFAGGVGMDKDKYFVDVAGAIASAGGNVYGFLAEGGYKIDMKGSSKPIQVCPSGTFVKMFGLGANPLAFSIGGQVGIDLMKVNTTRIVPTVGVFFNRNTISAGGVYGGTGSFSSNGMSLSAGAGLIFNDKMALVPSVFIPLSSTFGQATFEVVFSAKLR